MEEVFYSLGVNAIVTGGQTMNPSTQELLDAVEAAPSDKVVLLPNNSNIVLAAEQAVALTKKTLAIVPTKTLPQGVAALLALNNEADFATNVASMKKAIANIRTIEMTRAVRDVTYENLTVKEGQAIALLDGELVAANGNDPALIADVLAKLDLSTREVVTIYYGAGVDAAEAAGIAEAIHTKYAHLEVESIYGGQPYYSYILSVE
jgi:dihydroxyacetone kinase-like predicted kinase